MTFSLAERTAGLIIVFSLRGRAGHPSTAEDDRVRAARDQLGGVVNHSRSRAFEIVAEFEDRDVGGIGADAATVESARLEVVDDAGRAPSMKSMAELLAAAESE